MSCMLLYARGCILLGSDRRPWMFVSQFWFQTQYPCDLNTEGENTCIKID